MGQRAAVAEQRATPRLGPGPPQLPIQHCKVRGETPQPWCQPAPTGIEPALITPSTFATGAKDSLMLGQRCQRTDTPSLVQQGGAAAPAALLLFTPGPQNRLWAQMLLHRKM